jgi:histidinol-phosphate/aromatic aminotransferase/cobyric acid decarboxylase-like protein
VRSDPGRIPSRAVILVAGLGRRLGRASRDLPKPLTEVGGQSILERGIRTLAGAGVREVVLVTGHLADAVRDRIGGRFAGVEVRYAHNPRYAETNNLYSLWCARAYLDRDLVLAEGDVAFDAELLGTVPAGSRDNVVFAGGHARELRGTVVRRDGAGRVTAYLTDRDQPDDFDTAGTLKTANVYLLRGEYLRDGLLPALAAEVAAGRVRGYYDYALAASFGAARWVVADVSTVPWYEVDDPGDRLQAEYVFGTPADRRALLGGLHGSHWRFGVQDHELLYNVHFPPDRMVRAMAGALDALVRNYPAGSLLLAELVASVIDRSAREVSVANGSAELIKLLAQVPGRVAVPVPGFNEYENVLRPGQLVPYPLAAPDFHLDVDAYAEAVREQDCRVAVVVSPNNPTSVAVPAAELRRLCRAVAPAAVLLDESFVDFAAPPAGSLLPDLDEHPNLVVLKSVSKVYGVGGLRLGFSATADPGLARWIAGRLPIWNVNGLAEEFLRLLPHFRADFEASCALVRAETRELAGLLAELPGLHVVRPDANFVLLRLPAGLPAGRAADELFAARGILSKDCGGKTMPDGHRWLRVASRTAAENRALVDGLRQVLHGHAPSTRPA